VVQVVEHLPSKHEGQSGKEKEKYFKVCMKSLSELTNEFCKAARYKINVHKSVVLLYTTNDESKYEIEKIISFT
jgi:hypothetical protein